MDDKSLYHSVAPRFLRAAGARMQFPSSLPMLLLVAGLASLILALVLLPRPLAAWQVFATLAAVFGAASLHLALARIGRSAERDLHAPMGSDVEKLQDVRWQLSENEARYRALLDGQCSAIVRRDAARNLTFANKAFLDMFAAKANEVLGKPFELELCEPADVEPLTVTAVVRHQRLVQHALTAMGARWIEWEEQLVAAPRGGGLEVQSVGRDITEQRRFDMQLAEARDQAESANRAKGRFLAAMSHEIRTPMNGILGMASLLLETEQTPEQSTYAQAIDQSARTLLALIDEILDFSKIEAGKLELTEEPFALDACVQGAVELLAPRAHAKGLEMAWSVSPQLPRLVFGDEARVRQILLNLLSNAVKFTDAGGVGVEVGPSAEPCNEPGCVAIDITVEDTGIGLSPDDMRRLFTEFEQADAAVRRRDGGTGLGLAISMQLARAMRGGIRVASTLGKGSTFKACLVLQPVEIAANDAGQDQIGEGVRVLLAFDRPLERRALGYALASAGVATAEVDFAKAADVLDAALAEGRPFDRLVIDGVEGPSAAGGLLAKARQLNRDTKVRGIVLVNVLARSSLSEFRTAGFDAYLVRPVRPASLMLHLGLSRPEETSAAVRAEPAVPAVPQAGWTCARRVLLAEDNEINALLAKRVLEKCGCEHVAVANGAEAVAVVGQILRGETRGVDLILMDIFMPQLDGLEAARAIRQLYASMPAGKGAPPIVALTANAFAEDKQRYLEAGMDDYLAKPFDKSGLEAVLHRWFGDHGGNTDAAA